MTKEPAGNRGPERARAQPDELGAGELPPREDSRSPAEMRRAIGAILASATDYAIFTLDTAGTVTSWNVGAERLMGWTEAEAIGLDGRRLFTPEDRDSVTTLVWANPRSLATTYGITFVFFSSAYLDVSVQRVYFLIGCTRSSI